MRQAGPLIAKKFLRDFGSLFYHIVYDYGQDEGPVPRHDMRPLDGDFPLPPEITFAPLLRVPGDDWKEQCALLDLFSYLLVPRIAAAEIAFIEPHVDTEGPQRIRNA